MRIFNTYSKFKHSSKIVVKCAYCSKDTKRYRLVFKEIICLECCLECPYCVKNEKDPEDKLAEIPGIKNPEDLKDIINHDIETIKSKLYLLKNLDENILKNTEILEEIMKELKELRNNRKSNCFRSRA